MDFRVCVEFMAPRELAAPSTVALLARFRVAPMLAVPPGADEDAVEALRPFVGAGLAACAWPLLTDGEGYWPSAANAEAFAARVDALMATAARRGVALPWLAVDLEPPLDETTRLRHGPLWLMAPTLLGYGVRHLDRARLAEAEVVFAAMHKRLAAAGTRALAIAYPVVSADFVGAPTLVMEELCQSPLRCGWDRVGIMTYGSLIAGYSRGLLSVEDARWYGYRALADLASGVGARAGAFVGVVGKGKLGDEPAYADPAELGRDVAAARAAGVSEVALFCLEGLLAAPSPEAWLRALVEPEAQAPPATVRGGLLHRSINALAGALALARR